MKHERNELYITQIHRIPKILLHNWKDLVNFDKKLPQILLLMETLSDKLTTLYNDHWNDLIINRSIYNRLLLSILQVISQKYGRNL